MVQGQERPQQVWRERPSRGEVEERVLASVQEVLLLALVPVLVEMQRQSRLV